MIDAAADEQSLGYLHEVEAFFATATEAACRHPSARSSTAPIYPTRFHASHTDLSLQNFAAFPLFAAGGPTKDDFFQGSVGDHLLAPLSAGTDAHPDFVRRLVADSATGPCCPLHRDGKPQYVRVDVRGSVDRVERQLKYARFGRENSLWVPIVEKAYAFFRKQQGNYPSLSSGDGKHHGHLHATTEPMELEEVVTLLQVIDWVERGSPAGVVANAINDGGSSTNWIALAQANGEAVNRRPRRDQRLDASRRRRECEYLPQRAALHTVDHVEFDDNGQPVVLVLRDPIVSIGGSLTSRVSTSALDAPSSGGRRSAVPTVSRPGWTTR